MDTSIFYSLSNTGVRVPALWWRVLVGVLAICEGLVALFLVYWWKLFEPDARSFRTALAVILLVGVPFVPISLWLPAAWHKALHKMVSLVASITHVAAASALIAVTLYRAVQLDRLGVLGTPSLGLVGAAIMLLIGASVLLVVSFSYQERMARFLKKTVLVFLLAIPLLVGLNGFILWKENDCRSFHPERYKYEYRTLPLGFADHVHYCRKYVRRPSEVLARSLGKPDYRNKESHEWIYDVARSGFSFESSIIFKLDKDEKIVRSVSRYND